MNFEAFVGLVVEDYRNVSLGFVESIASDALGVTHYIGMLAHLYREEMLGGREDKGNVLYCCAQMCALLTNTFITANNKLSITLDVEAFEASVGWREVMSCDQYPGWSFPSVLAVSNSMHIYLVELSNGTVTRASIVGMLRWVARCIGHFGYSLETLAEHTYAITHRNSEATIVTE